MNSSAPKPKPIQQAAKYSPVSEAATAQVRRGIRKKRGYGSTALAGETGGGGAGFGGFTALG